MKIERTWIKVALAPLLALSAGLFALTGCSSSSSSSATGFDCNKVGEVCSNDKPPAPSDVTKCQSSSADATCGSKYQAWMQCAADHPACDASGNNQDSAFAPACATPLSDYRTCVGNDGGT